MLQSIEDMRVRGTVNRFFKLYFTNRKVRVKVQEEFRDLLLVKDEVPQGYVFGPLYLVYIKNIKSTYLNAECKIFADGNR